MNAKKVYEFVNPRERRGLQDLNIGIKRELSKWVQKFIPDAKYTVTKNNGLYFKQSRI